MKKPLKRLLSCQKLCQRNIPKKYGSLGAYQHQLLVITRLQNNDFAYAEQKGNLVSLEMLLVYIKLILYLNRQRKLHDIHKEQKTNYFECVPDCAQIMQSLPLHKGVLPIFLELCNDEAIFLIPFHKTAKYDSKHRRQYI